MNMNPLDSVTTTTALMAFKQAWQKSTADYAQRKLNSEHTLQASIYHHLRQELPDDFVVYTEAVVRLPESDLPGKKKVVLDLLICHGTEIIAAVELKYKPRGIPVSDALRKDIKSLSLIRNRRSSADRVAIEMPRFRSTSSDEMTLTISPLRKLILGVYCQAELSPFEPGDWWRDVRPGEDFWSDDPNLPRNLGIAVAGCASDGTAQCSYQGGPFQRIATADFE